MRNVKPEPFPMTAADCQASARLGAPRHPSSQAFHDLCDAMKAMHDKKQQDYGRANDPFSNVRATEEWGQPGWVGAMIRATDKLRRLQKVANGGTLANEGVEDSLMDLAVYSIIALVLFREEQAKHAPITTSEVQARFEEADRQAQKAFVEPLVKRTQAIIGKMGVSDELVRWDQPQDGSR